jgi:hypothetical protein
MRPPGEARQALLKAAKELTTVARSPTFLELTARACVGKVAALNTVRHMRRAGLLVIVRTRKVDYRNRPVAEYAPGAIDEPSGAAGAALGNVFHSWVR